MFKVGEYVECAKSYGTRLTKGKQYRVNEINGPYYRVIDDNGNLGGWREEQFVAVAGPVLTETVTKRRIVPGVYGRLEVGERDGSVIYVRLAWRDATDEGELMHAMTAEELDSLAMVASQLAEALRDRP